MAEENRPRAAWRSQLHEIIFEADTPFGKTFDILLLICIVLSVAAALLESVKGIRQDYGLHLLTAEWIFTILFTLEYIVRLMCVGRPMKYALSFYGIIDLLAIVPTYLSLVVAGTQSLIVIRALRLLRVFRVLKLAQFVVEARVLREALRESARKIIIFLGAVMTLVVITGAMMYLIEAADPDTGFTSIPQSIYWAIVTLTTVGYGDIAPQTVGGKALASLVMILGYGIIAVPTGIVTVELASARAKKISTQACPECSAEGHTPGAKFCNRCGAAL